MIMFILSVLRLQIVVSVPADDGWFSHDNNKKAAEGLLVSQDS